MRRIFKPYTVWEDYTNGMYDSPTTEDTTGAKELLSNQKEFERIALKVLIEWPIASDVNLSNNGCNRRAWIGQACCCYAHGVTEVITRRAWGELSNEIRNAANRTADKIIRIYEGKSGTIYKDVGESLLF